MPGVKRGAILAMFLWAVALRAETFVQASGADHIAFEAENMDLLTSNGQVRWETVSDADAQGGSALYASGSSLGTPAGTARYTLRFSTPGKYVLYSRWRADETITSTEPFAANSFSYPRTFGATPQWSRSLANERDVPESLRYDWTEDFVEYEVTGADVAAGRIFDFVLGTREAGLMLDRIVLKIGKSHPAAVLDSAPNSPPASSAPQVESVLAGHSLDTVTVRFSQPIARVAATNFTAAGLSVEQVGIDLGNSREVILRAAQAEGAEYALIIRGVAGSSGAPVVPTTNVFRAAQFVPGWARADLYFSPTASEPGLTRWLDRFEYQAVEGPAGGVELRGNFTPEADGRHALFTRSSGEVALTLWHDSTNGFTNAVTVGASEVFGPDSALLSPVLLAGERYGLSVRIAGTNGPAWLAVASRLRAEDELEPISGARLGALFNPDQAQLRITQQPASKAVAGGEQVTFIAQADAAVSPIYFQWQVNGANISGATNAQHTTPILNAGNSGDRYRVVVRAGGQTVTSGEAILQVSPGALAIGRQGQALVISWGAAAVGSLLETTAELGPNAVWQAVATVSPISEAGSLVSTEPDTRFFRLRK